MDLTTCQALHTDTLKDFANWSAVVVRIHPCQESA